MSGRRSVAEQVRKGFLEDGMTELLSGYAIT